MQAVRSKFDRHVSQFEGRLTLPLLLKCRGRPMLSEYLNSPFTGPEIVLLVVVAILLLTEVGDR